MKTTIELAKQAFADPDGSLCVLTPELEAFRALCVAERDKELLDVGMEPVARTVRFIGNDAYAREYWYCARSYEELPNGKYPDIWEKIGELYTAEQLAAARLQATEEAYRRSNASWGAMYEKLFADMQTEREHAVAAEKHAGELSIRHAHMSTLTEDQAKRIAELEAREIGK